VDSSFHQETGDFIRRLHQETRNLHQETGETRSSSKRLRSSSTHGLLIFSRFWIFFISSDAHLLRARLGARCCPCDDALLSIVIKAHER
jgi:hypothetical protein